MSKAETITPLGFNVLVEIVEHENKTKGGIILEALHCRVHEPDNGAHDADENACTHPVESTNLKLLDVRDRRAPLGAKEATPPDDRVPPNLWAPNGHPFTVRSRDPNLTRFLLLDHLPWADGGGPPGRAGAQVQDQ